MHLPLSVLAIGIFMFATLATAAVRTETVTYKQGDTTLKGVIAYDDATTDKRPGVLVFPEWWGMTDYPKHRAEQLAKLGYVAFAADMYGDGKSTDDPKEAGQWAGAVKGDNALLRARAAAALDQLKANPLVDRAKIAAIGYCFGGTVSLELARSGAPLAAVVSFHGDLSTKQPNDAANIKGKILICTGGDDAFVPPAQITAFEEEMRNAKVDYQVIVYGGAHHAFTNPDADRHGIDNIKYSESADKRSFAAMKALFDEAFGK